MAVQIQVRRDTAANWTSANPTLAQGEIGLETDTGKLKIGTGVTAWNSISYFVGNIAGTTLDAIGDVIITSVQNGDFLRYNGSASAWINDPVNLSTDTVGDYVQSLIAGTGVSLQNNSGEGATPTIAIGQAVSTSSSVTFGHVSAPVTGNVTGDLIGNADTATALETARTISLSGDLSGSVSFDGSSDVTITATVQPDSVALGTDTTGNFMSDVVAGTGVTVTHTAGESSSASIAIGQDVATSASVTFAHVSADLTGNVTGDLTGNASSATALETSRTISLSGDLSGSVSFDGTADVTISATVQPDSVALGTDTTGNYVNDVTAGTGVTVTHTPGEGSSPTIAIGQAVGTSASVTFAHVSADLTGDVTGNADTATALQNARVIALSGDVSGSVSFDGTGNVDISTTIGANSVALGSDTSGDYVSSLVAGTGVTLSNNSGETATPTVAIGQDVATSASVTFAKVDTTGDLTVGGNLTVNGTTTTLNTETLAIEDNIVTLNSNVTGSPSLNAGIEVERGDSANVVLRWNESTDKWETTNDGSAYSVIATNGNIALGTDTTGNYMSDVTASTGVTISHTPGEGSTATFSIGQPVGTSASVTFANVTADLVGNVTGDVTGNADTATALETARTILISGDVSGSVSFNGTSDVNISATIQPNSVALGSDTSGDYVSSLVAGTGVAITNNSGETATPTIAIGQAVGTSASVTFAHVSSPVTGNVTGDLTGNADTATALETARTIELSGDVSGSASFDGTSNINIFTTVNTASVAIGELYGVNITNPLEFQTLEYNGTEWVNANAPSSVYVRNAESTTITTGTAVYLFGATGDHATVKRADNTLDTTSSKTVGLVASNILASENGVVVSQGYVDGIDLSVGYTSGDVLWLGKNGQFTKTKPTAPDHLVFIGVVVRATNNGIVYVATQNGYELDELHNVKINGVTDGQFLRYNSSSAIWVNDTINLGTDTAGDYVQSLVAGTGVTLTNNSGESATPTVAIGQSVATSASVTFAHLIVQGDMEVQGTINRLNETNLDVESAFIYLNATSASANPDMGVAFNYNDGAYRHAGLFRDSSDGIFKVFEGYEPEPVSPINTSDATYSDARFQAESIILTQTTGTAPMSVSSSTVVTNLNADKLDGQDGSYYAPINSPTFTGTVSLPNNTVALGTQTTGNYVADVSGGTGVTVTHTPGEGTTPSVAIGQDVATSASVTFAAVTAPLVGNASTASTLQTPRTISLSGDVSGSVSFNGSSNVDISATIQPNSVALGTDTTGNYMSGVSAGTGISVSHTPGEGSSASISLNATLDNLSDVNASAPANGEFLKYVSSPPSAVPGTGGVIWTTRTSNFPGTYFGINSIAHGNNLWVAAGYYGNIRSSTDGTTWVTQTSNFPGSYAGEIFSVAYGNNLWIAAGEYGQLSTSTDAVTWVSRTSNFDIENIFSVAYGNNLWVAVGGSYANGSQLRTSTDAITWTTHTSNFGTKEIFSVAYGNSLWVAGGGAGEIRTSTDAVTWTTRTSNLGIFNSIFSIAYGNNLWVAGADGGQLRTSTDGITWTTRTPSITTTIQSVAYGNNLWTAAGNNGELSTSTDGTTWITRTSNFGTSRIKSVAFGNNLWVAGGIYGELRTSEVEISSLSEWTSDAINLGTDTAGDYVASLVAGTGVTLTNNSGETATPTIAIGQSVATSASVTFAHVAADVTGNVTGNVTGSSGSTTGNAATATALQNARNISLTGDVSGSVSFNGTSDVSISATIQPNSVALGTDTTGNYMSGISVQNGLTVSHTPAEGSSATIGVDNAVLTNYLLDGASGNSYGLIGTSEYLDVKNTNGYNKEIELDIVSLETKLTTDGYLKDSSTSASVSFAQLSTTGNVTVGGNLTVNGTTTTLNTETLAIEDNIVVLNSNVTGSPTTNAGIEIERGTSSNVSVRWNESSDKWELTEDGSAYLEIATTADVGAIVISSLDDIADVSASTAVSGDFLKYNGVAWVNDPINLGADTVGNYVNDVTAGTGVTVTHTPGEGSSPTIAIGQAVGTSSSVQFAAVTAPLIGNVTGNSDTATALATSRTIELTGDVTGSVSFNGSANASITATISANSVALGTDTTGNYVADVVSGTGITISHTPGEGSSASVALNATLDNLSDVTAPSPSDGQFLKYVSASTAWVPANIPTINALDDIGDVNAPSPTTGYFLKWDGSEWVPAAAGAAATTTSITANTETTIASFDKDVANAAEFTVKVEQGSRLLSNKVLVLHNGTAVDFTKYGEISIAATEAVPDTAATTWVTRAASVGSNEIFAAKYGGSTWVIGGYGSALATSTDAITWTTRTSPNSLTINTIAYGDNKFVAGQNYTYGAGNAFVLVSTDAVTWNAYGTGVYGFAAPHNINGLVYTTKWVGVTGGGDYITSTDAVTWTTGTVGASQSLNSLVYGASKYLTGGESGIMYSSTDAVTWTTQTSNFGSSAIKSVAYNNNLWVAAGDGGQIRTSTDAITWTTRTSNFGSTQIRSVEYGNNLWVAAGNYGQIRVSTDAVTWTTKTSNFGNTIINAVAFGNNLWIAGGGQAQLRSAEEETASVEIPLTLSADISGSDVRLRATITDAATTTATAKVLKTLVEE